MIQQTSWCLFFSFRTSWFINADCVGFSSFGAPVWAGSLWLTQQSCSSPDRGRGDAWLLPYHEHGMVELSHPLGEVNIGGADGRLSLPHTVEAQARAAPF